MGQKGHPKLVQELVQQITMDDDFAFSPDQAPTDFALSTNYRTLHN